MKASAFLFVVVVFAVWSVWLSQYCWDRGREEGIRWMAKATSKPSAPCRPCPAVTVVCSPDAGCVGCTVEVAP